MAKRDVELIVKARNEASKAIESVTSALDDLTKSQGRVSDGSEKTGSTLARLGAELEKLTASLTKSTGVDKLASSMDRAQKGVANLQTSLTKTAEDAVRLEAEMEQAASAVAKFAAESERLKNTLAAQKQTVAATQTEFKKLSDDLKAGETALAGSRAKSQQYVDSIGKQETALAKTAQRHRELATAILSASEPSAKLLDSFEKTDAKLRKQADTLNRTKADYSAYRATIGQLSTDMPRLQESVAKTAASLADAQSAVAKTAVELKSVSTDARAATNQFNGLKDALDKSTASLSKQYTSLNTAQTGLKELAQATDLARRKANELGTAAFQKVSADAAKLNQASEYVRWWTQALDEADRAEDKLNRNPLLLGNRAGGYANTAQAARQMASASREAAVGMADLESKGRAAMTWGERLRGQLLSLAAAYVGVFGAINGMRSVLRTVIDMDAAQTRLSVSFGDNQAVIAKEMQFVQAQADRLGISVKVLATEYSKLSVATKDTSLAGAETRRIFVSLAEAFRVGNLTQNQMELAFNAISQMVNKGSVSMEELRQQLGERLAGAFNIAAKSMGYTTKEFAKLVAEGKIVAEDFLPKLADELDRTFGPGLPRALQNIAADVGAFENSVIKAQMAFAKGGFTEGLQKALQELTKTLNDPNTLAGIGKLGAAVGHLIRTFAELANWSREIGIALGIVVNMKLLAYLSSADNMFVRLIDRFKAGTVAARASAVQFDKFGMAINATAEYTKQAAIHNTAYMTSVSVAPAKIAAVTIATRAAAVAQGAWNTAMGIGRGLMAAFGGPLGLAVTGATIALGYLLTRTNDVIDAVSEHQRQMGLVEEAYQKAAKSGGKWADSLSGITTVDIRSNLDQLFEKFNQQRDEALRGFASRLGGLTTLKRGDFGALGKEVAELIELARDGRISISSFRSEIARIVETKGVSTAIVDAAKSFSSLTQEAGETEKAIAQAYNVLKDAGVEMSGVSPAVQALAVDLKKLSDAAAEASKKVADPMTKINEQIKLLSEKIPALAEEAKFLEELKSIDEILKTADAIQGLDKTSDAYKRLLDLATRAKTELRQAFDAKQFKGLDSLLSGTNSGVDASAKLLRKFEGFKATPYWDVNAFRAGFGSDTVTLSDGTIQKVVQGMKVSVEDANRDLVRRIGEFQATVRGQVGSARFDTFSNEQQAVLTSIAYNYGSLPARIVEAVRTGSAQQIATAIRGLSGDNGGVNAGRRAQEAFLFENGSTGGIERQVELATKRAEKTKEYRDNLDEALRIEEQTAQAQLAAQDTRRKGVEMLTLEQAIQAELDKRRLAAKKQDQVLTEAQEAAIKRIVTLNYKREAQEKAAAALKERQAEGEQRINQLQQLRRDLLQQLQAAQKPGNTTEIQEITNQIASVDVRLREAIAKMREFWATSADPEAREAALASLKVIEQGIKQVGERTELTAKDFGNLFGENLQTAWSGFLTRVRDTGDVFGSLRESFRQFASDFLLQMAQMIAKVAILNALKGIGGGGGFLGQVFSGFAGQFHEGGIVGQGGTARAVSPAWFQNAVRYHSGGIAGLKPNEVPAVLEKGEEVLTANDPRHSANAGGGSNVKIINAIDSGSVVSEGLSTSDGERAFINFIRANKGTMKQILA